MVVRLACPENVFRPQGGEEIPLCMDRANIDAEGMQLGPAP
jgi:hypothetical protein